VSERLTLAERVSDRLNPILVREIQQSLRGRAFITILTLALCCIVVTAMMVASQGSDRASGMQTFSIALLLLAPILMFLVPFQAFLSTRREVSGGTAEHLLLTRLTPGAIVRGKLYAALVQFVLYLAVFAPLMALSYLLRGVDIPTIATFLGMALFTCVGATSFAVALGAGSGTPQLRSLPYVLAGGVLGGITVLTMSAATGLFLGVQSLVRDSEFWLVIGSIAMPYVLLVVLFGMGASSFLAHPYENRSTRFRLFAFLGLGATFVWMGFLDPAGHADDLGPGIAITAAAVLAFFWLFAVTEEEALSPRVWTLVPRRRLLAILSIPFLPGGGRGFLFTLILAGLAILGARLFPPLAGGVAPDRELFGYAILAWMYVILYAGVGRILRSVCGPGPARTRVARILLPMFFAVVCMGPILLQVLLDERLRRWSILHIGNPMWTLMEHDDPTEQFKVGAVLLLLCSAVIVYNTPAMVRGVREVLAASRARREREA